MAPRTLPQPNARMRVRASDGNMPPEFARFLFDWHGVLASNQKATDATIIASAPPAVSTSGSVTIYRPTTSAGSGYSAPTAAYDGNPATPATAKITGIQT